MDISLDQHDMRDTFPFLIRLSLEPDADAKDIRRAYARELKKIDQSADPDGFQQLREAYEVALQWQAHRQFTLDTAEALENAPEAAADTPIAPEAPPLSVPLPGQEDPYQLADQAYARFASSVEVLAQSGEVRHQSRWKAALQAILDHDSLLNLTARTIFEARIAHQLASGWKPGNETLFVVASDLFDWAHDSRRILQFGETGAMVNRAIDQWKLYESMPSNTMGAIKQLIQSVRATPQPEEAGLRNDLILFHQLTDRFHNWFAVIIDRQILQDWHNAAEAELQRNGAQAAVPLQYLESSPAPEPKSSWSAWSGWQLLFLILFVVKGCAVLLSNPDRAPDKYVPPSQLEQTVPGRLTGPELIEKLRSHRGENTASLTGVAPTEEQLAAVQRQIFYMPDPSKATGILSVRFLVHLDDMGKVIFLQNTRASRDPAFDEAVSRALMQSKVFPAGTQREFPVTYIHKIGGL
jgi:protein TonB